MIGRLASYLVAAIIMAPVVVTIGTSLTRTSYLTFPPQGLGLSWYTDAARDHDMVRALVVSVEVAGVAAAVATTLAVGASLSLARYRFRGKGVLGSLLLGPLMIPAISYAIGMLFFLTAIHQIGTLWGLIAGHVIVTFPFALRAVASSLSAVKPELERCAAILGAPPLVVFRRITMPLIAPGLMAAALFCFLVSLNTFTLTVFIAGPGIQTFPLLIFLRTQYLVSPELSAMATLVLIGSWTLIVVLEKSFGLRNLMRQV